MENFDKDSIKKLLNLASKSGLELHYAFGLAKKPEDCGFILSKKKVGRTLSTTLRADKSFRKVGYGTLTLDRKNIQFQVQRPCEGMSRQLKKRFSVEGIMFRPLPPEGEAEAAGPDGLPGELAARLREIDAALLKRPLGARDLADWPKGKVAAALAAVEAALREVEPGSPAQRILARTEAALAGRPERAAGEGSAREPAEARPEGGGEAPARGEAAERRRERTRRMAEIGRRIDALRERLRALGAAQGAVS